ncbi:MAG: TonB family protein [Spirochaetes bacterium]|nr:TonB family protein [Spirochaetota bacterium]
MTSILRRGMPWAVSVLLHALIVLIPVRLGTLDGSRQDQKRIELVFDQPAPRSAAAAYGLPTRDWSALPADAAPAPPRSAAAAADSLAVPFDNRPVEAPSADAAVFPSPRDVLADLPAPAAAPTPSSGTSAALAALTRDAVIAALPSSGAQIGWEGAARKLIRRRDPQFPRILSATGQEVECVARISVSPSGTVARVDIVKSSGYTEIDASIEGALRDYLFSKVEGKQNAIGTVSFRFRLEKRD